MTDLTLSPDQVEVLDGMMSWAENPNHILTCGGWAGSGKSTVLGVFAKRCVEERIRTAYISFTGRAAGVLARKLAESGVEACTSLIGSSPRHPSVTTIHQLLYQPMTNSQEEIIGWKKRGKLDEEIRFVVIDEASMVGDEMLRDLQALDVPILAVGDHGQLQPVRDKGSLMANPILRLEKIHRQAAGNPILQLAHRVRESGILGQPRSADGRIQAFGKGQYPDVVRQTHLKDRAIGDVAVICWKNATRVTLNQVARQTLRFKDAPKKGEPVVCLKNLHARGIYNGMRGFLLSDTRPDLQDPWILSGQVSFPEEQIDAQTIGMNACQFHRESTFGSVDDLKAAGIAAKTMGAGGALFDFGYAMSCHKMQGSQVKTAVVVVDRPIVPSSEDWRRWMYTATTRASERLVIIL